MHTVHLADETKNNYFGTAWGIIFDVNKHNAKLSDAEVMIIDNFFENVHKTIQDARNTLIQKTGLYKSQEMHCQQMEFLSIFPLYIYISI